MGRAIVRHPEVFLFDEPLSNLDAQLRTQMRAEIKRLHARLGVTSIYVTHDQVEAMTLADRIVVMSGGRIEQIGTPMEMFMNPANLFVAGFIGSPPMNKLKATIVRNDAGIAAQLSDDVQIALPAAESLNAETGQAVILGIRPEDVLLSSILSLSIPSMRPARYQCNGCCMPIRPWSLASRLFATPDSEQGFIWSQSGPAALSQVESFADVDPADYAGLPVSTQLQSAFPETHRQRIATLLVPYPVDQPRRVFHFLDDQGYDCDLYFTGADEHSFKVTVQKLARA